MTTGRGSLLAGLCAIALLAPAAPAGAFWAALGSGTGLGAAATMPAGNPSSGVVSSQSVTLSWAQSSFLGSPLGSYVGGGYTITRYANASSIATAPSAGCAATVSGAGATLGCAEPGVPYGAWQYTVTPVLDSFIGAESAKSTTVSVVTAPPVLNTVTAQNPSLAQTTGDIPVSWASVSGATGYNVYRRTAAGSYDFASPLNGATPLGLVTTYADSGLGLSPATTFHYVVRAVAGLPTVESASSNERNAATISRPAAPSGNATATAAAAARIDVSWPSVAGVAGYNVYRRTLAGSYDFAAPLNGATPLAAPTRADLTAVNATSYVYTARSVITGAGGAQVESANSGESLAVTADSVAPPAPTALAVTSGGNVWGSTSCSITSGTRYLNAAGASAGGVSAAIAAPEANETVVFSATTNGATPVTATVAALGTTVATTLNVSTLADGTATLTARTKDLAGNLSATVAPPNVVIKDTAAPSLSAAYSGGLLGLDPHISGNSECGAAIAAVKTAGGNLGALFPLTISTGTAFNVSVEGPLLGLGSVTYSVTSTDRAGNLSAVVSAGG